MDKTMVLMTGLYRFLSIDIWGGLPPSWQKEISKVYTSLYNKSWSRWIIGPYCDYHYKDPDYLSKFVPANGGSSYTSFQDFFSRKLVEPPLSQEKAIWPAEGLLCEYGQVIDLKFVRVKGEERQLRTIFGEKGIEIPDSYFFSNIFLHNNNYHRIHAPVSGLILRIERISGDLVLLRPWIYKNDPSLPALRNERVNIDIEDEQGNTWFLSIVGGPAVGTIQLPPQIQLGSQVNLGDELSIFLLGSTCCMAAPMPSVELRIDDQLFVGDKY